MLERGNLALHNSMVHAVPVRVTRKQRDPASYMKDAVSYSYLGLFKVLGQRLHTGKAGYQVCPTTERGDAGWMPVCLSCVSLRPRSRLGIAVPRAPALKAGGG